MNENGKDIADTSTDATHAVVESAPRQSLRDRLKSFRASKSATSAETPVDNPLFALKPITEEQDDQYRQQAASGYTPKEIEQGKPYFDKVQQKKDAEDMLAKAKAELDQVRSQYKKDTVDVAVSGSSNQQAEDQKVKPISLEDLHKFNKTQMTRDELYQAGLTDMNGLPITREDAQAAAWRRAQASGATEANLPVAPSNEGDVVIPKEPSVVAPSNEGDVVIPKEPSVVAPSNEGDAASAEKLPVNFQDSVMDVESNDPEALLYTQKAIEATAKSKDDRDMRRRRTKFFEQVVDKASDEVKRKLAARDKTYRSRYLKNKRKELLDTSENRLIAINKEIDIYKEIMLGSGLSESTVNSYAADRKRGLLEKWFKENPEEAKLFADKDKTLHNIINSDNETEGAGNDEGVVYGPPVPEGLLEKAEDGAGNDEDRDKRGGAIRIIIDSKLDEKEKLNPPTNARSIIKSKARKMIKPAILLLVGVIALNPIKGVGDERFDPVQRPVEPTPIVDVVNSTPTAEPTNYIVVDDRATAAPTETATPTAVPTETATPTAAPTETATPTAAPTEVASTVETSVEDAEAKDIETILNGSVVLNIDRPGDSVSQSMLDEHGLSLKDYNDGYYSQWDVASATCLVNWTELEAAWSGDGLPISRNDYLAIWERAQGGDEQAQRDLVKWSNTLLDRQQVGQHPVEFSTPDEAREANAVLYARFEANQDQFATFLNDVQQGREEKVQDFITIEFTAQVAPEAQETGKSSRSFLSRFFNRRS